jgi:hypothetical protein
MILIHNENLDEVLHQAALRLDDDIVRMDEWLQAASQSPTVRRLERCARSVHRKREQLRKALEADDRERVIYTHVRLLEELLRFYRILGA